MTSLPCKSGGVPYGICFLRSILGLADSIKILKWDAGVRAPPGRAVFVGGFSEQHCANSSSPGDTEEF